MAKKQSPAEHGYEEAVQSTTQLGALFGVGVNALANLIKEFAPMLVRVVEAVQNMPEAMQKSLICLANEGWYLDWKGMSLSEPTELAQMYLDGRNQEVDEQLVEHFTKRLLSIEQELICLYPKRAEIFRQAFQAHRQGMFYVSVPTFLAQADGICDEVLQEHFFQQPSGAKHQFKKLSDLDPLTNAMLAPFWDKTAIRLSKKVRPLDFNKLNRHQVLHGESYDYGTEVHALQAISFVYYMAVTLDEVIERHRDCLPEGEAEPDVRNRSVSNTP